MAATLVVAVTAVAYGAPPGPREVDVRRLAAAGLRVLDGEYVRVLTDLPSTPAIDELPAVFDAAVPQWCRYFDVPPANIAGRRWLAMVIADRERFAALGLMPADRPEFKSGYARNWELWLVDQPSDYYRRHLFLHEGTHAFMQTQLGGCGAGWYMEGTAELLGTHWWASGRLKLGVMPSDKEAVPMWGRIKLIRDAAAADRAWPLEAVLAMDNSREMSPEHYAWTWALAALLDGHPMFQQRFRKLKAHAADPRFNDRFRELFAEDWRKLAVEWQALVATLDYGYDVLQMAIVIPATEKVGLAPQETKINANRGWQSTGWMLRAGKAYQLTARDRYQIAFDREPWPCEPGGITIDYQDGWPLGALLGAFVPTGGGEGEDPSFAKPLLIGLGTTFTPKRDGVLFVRVNDSPAKLGDNEGELTLRVEQADR